MIKSICILLFLSFYTFNTYSQAPAIEWQKCFGGTAQDYSYSIEQTSDGGYITAGVSSSNDGDVSGNHGNYDFWVVKLSNTGSIEWQKSLGGTDYDVANSIKQTSDGGYIVAGESSSIDGDVTNNHSNVNNERTSDFWIVKLDAVGTIEWQKSLGGEGPDQACSVFQTVDGGYIATGGTLSNNGDVTGNHGGRSDYWVVKLDNDGSIEWQKTLGGSGYDWAYSIVQTSNGGYIVAGRSDSNDGDVTGHHGVGNCLVSATCHDYWIVKLDNIGTIEWQKSIGGTNDDWANSITQTNDGGFIVLGYSESNDGDVTGNHGYFDYWVVKLDSLGSIQWQKSLGGTRSDSGFAIKQTSDGGYIVSGDAGSIDGDVTGNHGIGSDYWVVKLDSIGSILWEKSFGGTLQDVSSAIRQTNDGGYIISGSSRSNDGDVTGNHTGYVDYWIVKLGPDTITGFEDADNVKVDFYIFPNPASSEITVSGYSPAYLKLCNTVGQTVAESQTNKLYVGNLSQGLYVLQLFDAKGQQVKTEKVIVAK